AKNDSFAPYKQWVDRVNAPLGRDVFKGWQEKVAGLRSKSTELGRTHNPDFEERLERRADALNGLANQIQTVITHVWSATSKDNVDKQLAEFDKSITDEVQ